MDSIYEIRIVLWAYMQYMEQVPSRGHGANFQSGLGVGCKLQAVLQQQKAAWAKCTLCLMDLIFSRVLYSARIMLNGPYIQSSLIS